LVNGIIARIEDLNTEVQDNMTKSVEYSEFLDNLALRPVGKTKLTYIKELIDIESFKPLT
jgi:predicted DNA-binding protein